jgi:hypothetical protein
MSLAGVGLTSIIMFIYFFLSPEDAKAKIEENNLTIQTKLNNSNKLLRIGNIFEHS